MWYTFPSIRQCLRHSSLLLVSLIVLSEWDGQSAYATCGDYLNQYPTNHTQNSRIQHRRMHVNQRETVPSCHQDHSLPTVPVQTPVSPISSDAILTGLVSIVSEHTPSVFTRLRSQLAEPDASRIFRPPRLV